ncbi:hypothetical protein L9059_19025 [Pseudomonas sp. TNT19]|jgi:hypothetical protein|uniref:Uncharacterized protein n=1 Tax=Pseudomonas violetae TaxID=2915813 RepID=A0ABT0F2M9_9PSED|nr:hypothetical protein [Pseudomonas violetae]MCK1792238.1 hypothetical protein [Pseudomonas violetae]
MAELIDCAYVLAPEAGHISNLEIPLSLLRSCRVFCANPANSHTDKKGLASMAGSEFVREKSIPAH